LSVTFRRHGPGRRLALLLAAASLLATAYGERARAADPALGFREPTSVVEGLGVSQRVDAGGANFSRVPLPVAPSVGFQVRLAPPIVGEPTADGDGGVLVAHGRDRVSRLDAAGRSLWSARLGAELASGAIPFGAGRYLLVARDGRLFELSAAGSFTERAALSWNDVDTNVLYAPTREGGAIVANGARVARIGPGTTRGFELKLKSVVRAVFDWRGATLAVTRDGSIWARRLAGNAEKLTGFGAPVAAALLVGDRLFGLAEHELLSVQLSNLAESVVWAEPALELRDLASAAGQKTRIVAGRSTLIELDVAGHELARVALGAGESAGEIASIVIDAAGASLVASNGVPLTIITPEGDTASIAGTGCADPLRPAPVGRHRAIAACRSGLVRGLSDRAR
jgi:hypothetical protein